jgi:beta-lactam-binding protein with PASTA domain
MRFLLSIATIALTGYLIFTTITNYFSVDEVTLPDVSGMDIEEATRTLESLGFKVKTYSQLVSGAPGNSVTAQSPSAGAVVRQGRQLSLGVNASGDIVVPLIIGSTQEQAKTILNAVGLELGEVSYAFSEIPNGQVLSQAPEQTSKVSLNTKVSVVISRGPNVPMVTLPEVRGLNIDAAKQRLRSLGFASIDTVPSSISSDKPQTVTQQSPKAGEAVPTSTRITLGYSLSSSIVAQVPNLIGSTLKNAQALLNASGLVLGPVNYVTDPAQPGGVVTYAPSKYTLYGTPVMVTFNGYEPIPPQGTPSPPLNATPTTQPTPTSTAAPTPNPAPAPTLPDQSASAQSASTQSAPVQTSPAAPLETPPPASTTSDSSRDLPFDFDPKSIGISALLEKPYKLRMEVEDERGKRELFNRSMGAGESVSASYKVYGVAQVQVYINDILYQSWSY